MDLNFMEVLCSVANDFDFEERFLYLDNDFLTFVYKDEVSFASIFETLSKSVLIVDPLTKFEFLRGMYVPTEKTNMEIFVNRFRMSLSEKDKIFQNLQKDALNLSLIYSHKGRTNGVSTVDLLLASRIIQNKEKIPLLITGNRKDFPSFIFDTKAIFNIENSKNDETRMFFVLELNQNHFDLCMKDLEKVTGK